MSKWVSIFMAVAITAAASHAYAAQDDTTIAAIKRQLAQQSKAIAQQKAQLDAQQLLITLLEKKLTSQDKAPGAAVAESRTQDLKSAQMAQASQPDVAPPKPREVALQSQPDTASAGAQPAVPAQSVPIPLTSAGQATEEKTRPTLLVTLLEKRLSSQRKAPGSAIAEATTQDLKLAQASQPDAASAGASPAVSAQSAPTPLTPVGQAPEDKSRPPEIQTIASLGGVLTRAGTFVIEPYAEYVHTSLNQFTFEGVQVIDALLIGTINAGRTQQDLGLAGLTVRYGITDELEVEARVPYIYRAQNFVGTLLNSSNNVLDKSAHGSGLGDIEGALHYQINDGSGGWPFFVGNIRYKSDSGVGPWDVGYNPDGSAQKLPTGSGFSAINPSLTVIYPTDPAVLYGNFGWIHNFDTNRAVTINQSLITQIRPGDTYSGSFGIGISLNDDVSFSLGYEQDYIQATTELVNGAKQNAQSLMAGELAFGLSLKTVNQNSINLGLNVGVTRDAPDVALTLRTPFTFGPFSP